MWVTVLYAPFIPPSVSCVSSFLVVPPSCSLYHQTSGNHHMLSAWLMIDPDMVNMNIIVRHFCFIFLFYLGVLIFFCNFFNLRNFYIDWWDVLDLRVDVEIWECNNFSDLRSYFFYFERAPTTPPVWWAAL